MLVNEDEMSIASSPAAPQACFRGWPDDLYRLVTREGAYWGIRTNLADFGLPDALPCPFEQTSRLAELPTRLKALDKSTQERLINWGFAVCDAALRRYADSTLAAPVGFPYPEAGVG